MNQQQHYITRMIVALFAAVVVATIGKPQIAEITLGFCLAWFLVFGICAIYAEK